MTSSPMEWGLVRVEEKWSQWSSTCLSQVRSSPSLVSDAYLSFYLFFCATTEKTVEAIKFCIKNRVTLYLRVLWLSTSSVIIIILLYHQHRYPRHSFATPPYRSLLLSGPQGYIPYPHRAAICRFELVTLLLLGHVRRSIGEHHLWAHPCFSSSVLHLWFI